MFSPNRFDQSARALSLFEDTDLTILFREEVGGAETRESGADDVDGWHVNWPTTPAKIPAAFVPDFADACRRTYTRCAETAFPPRLIARCHSLIPPDRRRSWVAGRGAHRRVDPAQAELRIV